MDNSSPIKNVIKYILIIALIVGLVFLSIRIFFPQPLSNDAHNKSISIQESKSYENLINANKSLLGLLDLHQGDENFNAEVYHKLKVSTNLIEALELANTFMQPQILYATNTKTYNSSTRQINRIYNEITKIFEQTDAYIKNTLTPFLESETKNLKAINQYAYAVSNYSVNFVEKYYELTSFEIEVFGDLPKSFTVNDYSIKLLNSLDNWALNLKTVLTKGENISNYFENSKTLLDFTKTNLNLDFSTYYYTHSAQANGRLAVLKAINVFDLVKVINTSEEQNFINKIENSELKQNYQTALNFFKGGE